MREARRRDGRFLERRVRLFKFNGRGVIARLALVAAAIELEQTEYALAETAVPAARLAQS